jgi:lipoate-protein ligase A
MVKWRIIDTDYGDGYYNMALDEALLLSVSSGQSPPILRFYRWNPPTLTLGYFQKLEKEVLPDVCKSKGIQIVRRLTGGRAILHQHELTYSVIASEKQKQVSGSIIESYLKISKALSKGLSIFGVETEMAARPSKEKGSAACFDAPSWYEIVWQGKKLVGSAQTRKYGCLLQHGSIPFKIDIELLFEVLNIEKQPLKERLKNNFTKKAVGLEDILNTKIDCQKLISSLVEGFKETFQIEMEESNLNLDEQNMAKKLSKEKYATDTWNYYKGKFYDIT